MCVWHWRPQSRQSAKLFLQSSELGLPQPLTRRRVCPPPPLWHRGKEHTRWRERGLGESLFRRGDIHCGTPLCIYMYFVLAANLPKAFQTPVANLPQALLTPADVTAINLNLGKDVTTGVVNTRGKICRRCQWDWRSVFPPVSLTLVVGNELWIFPRIFKEKFEMA